MEGFALAQRAPARPGQALPLAENETALGTFGRLDEETPAGPVKGLSDMLQMSGDLLLGDAKEPGEVMGRERSHLQLCHDEMADRIVRLGGRTGHVAAFIVLPDHEKSILHFRISGSARTGPEDD
jgi:hypothetical protein